MLVRAGVRAESLAAAAEARRYFEQAAELAQTSERAALLDRAGEMAARAGDPDSARRLYGESIELHEAHGDTRAAARVLGRLARLDAFTGRRDEALARMERAFAVLSADEPDEDLALLAGRLALSYWYSGDLERAEERAELALDVAEAHAYPAALAVALKAKSAVAESRGHAHESRALMKEVLEIALEADLVDDASSAYFVLSDQSFHRDEYADALGYLDEALALTRKVGNRPQEWAVLAERTYPLCMLGRWDEAQAESAEFTPEKIDTGGVVLSLLESAVEIHIQRGELDGARRIFLMFSRLEESTDVQERSCYLGSRAALRRAEGRFSEALADGEATIEVGRTLGMWAQAPKRGLVEAMEAAFALGESAKLEELLAVVEQVPAGSRPPYLDAQARRLRGRLAGDAAGYEDAAARFRELGMPFWLAVTLLEHGELTGDGSLLAEARELFERLGARPWLDRVDAAVGSQRQQVPA